MSAKYSFISPLVFCVKILKEQKTQIKTHTHTLFSYIYKQRMYIE